MVNCARYSLAEEYARSRNKDERVIAPVDDGLGWARQFSRIAVELSQVPGTSAVLGRIAELATDLADCPWAAIARVTDQGPVVAATNDPKAAALIAQIQATAGGGPSWHAATQGEEVHVADLAVDDRWPNHFRQLLASTPVRSIAALPLKSGERRLGALTLYGDRPRAFSAAILDVARVYAEHAALALETARTEVRAENLEIALRSSREIGVAIGILVERHKLSTEQAFDMLRAASQHTGRKLREVASELVLTGDFEVSRSTAQHAANADISVADSFGIHTTRSAPPAEASAPE